MDAEELATAKEARPGMRVVSADGDELGTVQALASTHIRVGPVGGGAAGMFLWIPKTMIHTTSGDLLTLNVNRAEMHDAVFEMSPGEQREYATLGLHVKLGRARGLAL